MPPELAAFPEISGAESLSRSRRALRVFLLASLLAHAAVIIGLPDFVPGFATPRVSVLEVTILGPEPLTVAAAQPEPRVAVSTPEQQSRAEQKKPAQDVPKPASGGAAPGVTLPQQETEVVGSFAVAPSRTPVPPTAVPDPATEAAGVQSTPPSFVAAYLSNPPPRYPQAARRAGEQGTVTLRVMVKRDGLPARVEIEKSSGSKQLDAAAQDAVWGWRFVPARHGNDPIESWVLVPVVFRLEGAL